MTHVRMRFPTGPDWLALSQVQAMTDLEAWARASVAARTGKPGKPVKPSKAEPLVTYLMALGENYLRVGGTGCLFHVRDGVLQVGAMLRLETYEGPSSAADFRRQCELMIPETAWLVDPVSVSQVETAAGPATRLHVRFADPRETDAVVRDTVYWSWWFPDLPETVLASAAFANTADAAAYLPAFDGEVLAFERADGPPAEAGTMPEGDYVG